MKSLPKEITTYLVAHALEKRSPAYLCIGRNAVLKEFGGDTARYGIGSLTRGSSALDQVPFLEGLLPLRQPSLVLPCVQIDSGNKADVHIISDGSKHWVLLLSIVEEEIEHLHLLEKACEHNTLHERHTKILDQYLGKELVKALDEGQIKICESGERRHVSILFADIREFTAFSEMNPPEVVFATLNHYLDAMIRPLLEESAVVDRIMGDAVMGVFGILTMAVSPPHQAVVAALKILTAVRDMNQQLAKSGKAVLEVGIGISTGPVAVGILGSTVRKTFSVVGHHVNLAARLQDRAEPFEILVDENTYKEIVAYQRGFRETDIVLKGVTGQVKAYAYRMQAA
ncbi:MAG TPA: adenylate/guanylate cyclase domain-containing protein [Deltaproteobacteria bacterium]|nr:adenylate/guanylate cyclase domain-containing protein [Deltaproteobacteria bacterium]